MKRLLLVITLAFATAAVLQAGDRYRFTDQFGQTTGYAQPDYNGGYRYTDQFGQTSGYAHPNFNGGWRFTDQFGQTTGYQH